MFSQSFMKTTIDQLGLAVYLINQLDKQTGDRINILNNRLEYKINGLCYYLMDEDVKLCEVR